MIPATTECVGGAGPRELQAEGSSKHEFHLSLISSGLLKAPIALRIDTSSPSSVQDCVCSRPACHPPIPTAFSPFQPPGLFSVPPASHGFPTPGPLHTQFPLPEIILPCSTSFNTHSSLQSQFRSHFPEQSFPQLAPSLAAPVPSIKLPSVGCLFTARFLTGAREEMGLRCLASTGGNSPSLEAQQAGRTVFTGPF